MMDLPNIRGEPVLAINRLDQNRVDYEGVTKDLTLRVKQPVPSDLGAVKAGAARCSRETVTRYTYVNMRKRARHDPITICGYPDFKTRDLGHLFLVMMVDDHVVGFGRHYYAPASELTAYKVKNLDAVLAECALCFADEFQRKGLGSLYAQINRVICRDNGASWLVGTTFTKGGMATIRMRDGFEVVEVVTNAPLDQIRIRGRLS